MQTQRKKRVAVIALALYVVAVACVSRGPKSVPQHGWWRGLGPVLPHDSFPADCRLCHIGQKWQELAKDFDFDHEAETGIPLIGAHDHAQCIRCHNDRGPVGTFYAQGCGGCHEDIHVGELGSTCTDCHQEQTWLPVGQVERHSLTRFPLVGIHAITPCFRCHPGATVGRFRYVNLECLSCHATDLANAKNPNHYNLGWVDNCDECHRPTNWNQAVID